MRLCSESQLGVGLTRVNAFIQPQPRKVMYTGYIIDSAERIRVPFLERLEQHLTAATFFGPFHRRAKIVRGRAYTIETMDW